MSAVSMQNVFDVVFLKFYYDFIKKSNLACCAVCVHDNVLSLMHTFCLECVLK